MRHTVTAALLASGWLLWAGVAGAPAQVAPPVFGGGASLFDPEISVVRSGAVLDAQAVVSHDRRYVTINTRASQTRLLALRPFQVQSPLNLGFVGGANPTADAGPDAPVLERRGMFLIKELR